MCWLRTGRFQGKGRGKTLRVELGPFYAWLGEPAPVQPEWARAYDIRPGDQAAAMERRGDGQLLSRGRPPRSPADYTRHSQPLLVNGDPLTDKPWVSPFITLE